MVKLYQYEDAIINYSKALEVEPNSETVWNNKGWVLEKISNYEEAMNCYNKALEIKPDFENATNNKNRLFEKLFIIKLKRYAKKYTV